MKRIIVLLTTLTLVAGCSRITKTELEKTAGVFLKEFQKKLKGSDEDILKLFASSQSKDELLKAILILQNKDSIVHTTILYDSAKTRPVDSYAVIDLPVDLSAGEHAERVTLSFQFYKNDGQFKIGWLAGQELYRTFSSIKYQVEHGEALERLMADRKIYYDRAKQLQKDYDTIVWYVHHKNMTYYYAVKGTYNFDLLESGAPQNYKMGLVDENGKVIVPTEFELVANPSLLFDDMVEVKRSGKVGYHSLEGKEIIPANYDWIVPFEKGFANALVKKDSVFGWLDKEYAYHENFPSAEAEHYIKNLEYLTHDSVVLSRERVDLINVMYPLNEDGSRSTGLVIPSAYLVSAGIFSQVEANYITQVKDGIYTWGNEYSQAKVQVPFSITNMLSGFVTEFKKRFVGGRGEFYDVDRVSLVDNKANVVASIPVSSGGDFKIKKVNDTLYQYSSLPFEEEGPGDNFPEYNVPTYGYLKFSGEKFILLQSHRRFAFTEFLKLDSSFLTGNFKSWDNQVQKTSTFLSARALEVMRDEILASYGFIFEEPEKKESFRYAGWYKPTVDTYDEAYNKATDIDKYNLDFLAKLIGPYSKSS